MLLDGWRLNLKTKHYGKSNIKQLHLFKRRLNFG